MTTSTSGEASWNALVGTALLGTDRRAADLTALPAPTAAALTEVRTAVGAVDAATTLLDAAALVTLYRRAGGVPLLDRTPLVPAPVDEERPSPAAAAARLGSLLARLGLGTQGGGSASGGGGARADALLRTWLQLTRDARCTVPPVRLPVLLDLAVRRPEIAAAVAPVLGPRGWWLAEQRADWADAVDPHRPSGTPSLHGGPGPDELGRQDDEQELDAAWEHGSAADRRAWLQQLRRRDPAAARTALLALTWRAERADDRAAFVAALTAGLSGEDEELLERARVDRSQDVRRTAEALLARLPDAAWSRRVHRAALAAVHLQRQRLRRVLVITLPDPTDPALPVVSSGPAPAGVGPGVWALQHLIAITPPSAWEEALGEDVERLIVLPVDGGLGRDLHAAWAQATVLHRDARWARTLLNASVGASAGYAAGYAAQRGADLLALLPQDERVAAVAALVTAATRTGTGDDSAGDRVGAAVAACPGPWPQLLADAVLDWLAKAARRSRWVRHDLLERAAHCLPATLSTAGAVRAVAEALHVDNPWRPALSGVADTVAERHQMLEEFR